MLYPLRDWPDYSITPEGQVWSHKRNKWLSIFPKKHYYHAVKLSHNGVSKQFLIHTLVGRTFLPYVEGAKILHRDETLPFPDIHYLSNLWVGSMKDNSEDMVAKGRYDHWTSERKLSHSEHMRKWIYIQKPWESRYGTKKGPEEPPTGPQ